MGFHLYGCDLKFFLMGPKDCKMAEQKVRGGNWRRLVLFQQDFWLCCIESQPTSIEATKKILLISATPLYIIFSSCFNVSGYLHFSHRLCLQLLLSIRLFVLQFSSQNFFCMHCVPFIIPDVRLSAKTDKKLIVTICYLHRLRQSSSSVIVVSQHGFKLGRRYNSYWRYVVEATWQYFYSNTTKVSVAKSCFLQFGNSLQC